MKEKFNRKTIWTLGSFIIIAVGVVIVYYNGYIPMQEAIKNNPEINEIKCGDLLPYLSSHCSPWINRDVDFPQRMSKDGHNLNISIHVTATNTVLFVGDNVNFVAISGISSVDTDVKQIYVLFIDSHKQVKQSYNFTEAENEVNDAISSGTPMIELTPKVNDTYEYNPAMLGSMTIHNLENGGLPPFAFSSEGDKIIQVFLVHNSNGRVESKVDPVPFFTVYPNTARLQATTEIDTIKQIRLQNITDADIVGLSWVAIGLAFLVVGSDILLRIFLDPYTDDMKKIDTSNEGKS